MLGRLLNSRGLRNSDLTRSCMRHFASRASGDELRKAFAYCSEQVRWAKKVCCIPKLFATQDHCVERRPVCRKYDHDNFICSLQLKQVDTNCCCFRT